MKLRYGVAAGALVVLGLAFAVLLVAISHDSPCTSPASAPPGAETMRAVVYTCYGGPEVLAVAEVTGVCSTRNVSRVYGLGADHVIDYKKADYTTSGEHWDVIVDNVGNHGLLANRGVLTDNGIYVMVGGPSGAWFGPVLRPLRALLIDPFVKQELVMLLARQSADDLETLAAMASAGKLRTVIDRRFALDETAAAITYSETGHARGKIILEVGDRR